MQSSHAAVHVSALFDERSLIADAELLPLVALAERVGLPDLAATVRIEAADNSGGARAPAKMMSLLGAMCRGRLHRRSGAVTPLRRSSAR
ncbi:MULTISPECIES: hypothetical protein [Streptomyces]|uniref:IS1380 family transposase n=1 Tax=Streptomyces virginiae TaxID=1961 RepID=A0ABZ1TR38_STRVG|nr:hypothetical protein [Streptomyces virginiae]WTB27221.1 hypothetical protein OG253_40405 [Streptomyces virginiae]